MLTLTGVRPASSAASIPSSTRATGKSMPFIAPNTASSSESRLTVTRSQPGVGQRPCERAQGGAVRGQGQVRRSRRRGVRRAASMAMRSGRSRRTRGSPPVIRSFSTPERDERPGGPLDLLERQDLVAGQERVVPPVDLLGHAVRAAEVAAVGDRDAQVVERAAEGVEGDRHRRHRTPDAPWCSPTPTALRTGPTVRPARTAGTSSGLHHTRPRWHDAATADRPPRASRQQRSSVHGHDRCQTRVPTSVECGSDRRPTRAMHAAADAAAAATADVPTTPESPPPTEETESPAMIDAAPAATTNEAAVDSRWRRRPLRPP